MSDVFVNGVYYDSGGFVIPDYRPLSSWSNWLKSFEIFERAGAGFNFKHVDRGFIAGHVDKTSGEDIERLKSYGWQVTVEYSGGPRVFYWPSYDYGWNRIRLDAIDRDYAQAQLLEDRMASL